jgi:hypothetical protein
MITSTQKNLNGQIVQQFNFGGFTVSQIVGNNGGIIETIVFSNKTNEILFEE